MNDSWSGTINHYNIGTGITNTTYNYIIDVDKFPVSWDSTRSEVRYSGFTASYYTPRFMDPNISYNFASDFTYKSGSSSGSLMATIYNWNWTGGNKYSYYLPGSPNRNISRGRTQTYMANGHAIHLTANIRMECKRDLASLVCGSKIITKSM